MGASSLDALSPDDKVARSFRAALDTLSPPIFAVLDGARFDDLEEQLSELGISSRSLFLPGGDAEMRSDGPWLVALKDRHTRDLMEQLALEKPCVVFWSCPSGEQALWRHLRTINEILVPDDRIPDIDRNSGQPVKYERVLFRHWDPDVLAQALPAFQSEQYKRFLGVAAEVLFVPDKGWESALMRAHHYDDPAAPNTGLLKLTPDTIRSIADRRLAASRARRTSYLLKTCRDEVAHASDDAIAEHIRISEETGLRLGLESEAAHCRWAFIVCKSNGRVLQSREAMDYISKGGDHPDVRVKQLMSDTLKWLESERMGTG